MTEITKYENPNQLLATAELLFRSGMFPAAKNPAGVFCIIEYGHELGLPPVVALQNICVVKGRLCMSGQSMLAIAIKNGVSFKILEETKEKCTIDFKRGDIEYTSTFTIEDADKVTINADGKKLSEKDNWVNYRQEMLKWRAVSKGLRVIAPDFISGLYMPEEITSIREDKVVDKPTPESTPEPTAEDKGVTEQDVKDVFEHDPRRDVVGNLTDKTPKQKAYKETSTKDNRQASDEVWRGKAYPAGSEKSIAGEDKITDPQIKAIRTILFSKGIDAFYMNFKKYLKRVDLLKNVDTIKSMTKNAASELLSDIDGHLVSFFTLGEYHEEMKRVFNFLAKGTKVKILMTLTYFVKDIDSLPKKITEDLSDEYANNYFELFLKAIANQNDGKLPVEHRGDKEDGVLPPLTEEPSKDNKNYRESGYTPPAEEPPKEKSDPEFGF